MKKILFSIMAILVLMQPVMAEFVKPEIAAGYAQGVLGMKESPEAENSKSMLAPGRDSQVSVPDYYVFNNPDGGWVIIAADDRVNPIIAYSDEGSFICDGMPENLQWWMDGVSSVVNAVRESDETTPEYVRAAWEALKAAGPVTEGNKKYINTAAWGQSEPFNDLCPIANGETRRAASGCVATAMSIIMHYNRWPLHGKGVIGGYTTYSFETYIPSYSIEKHFYDWDIMSDEILMDSNKKDEWSDSQKYQIAQLIHDCGVAAQMDYTYEEGSGTSDICALNAFKQNMSYSEKARIVYRSSYKLDDWFPLIKNEIDNGRVLYYAGYCEAGGHAFVCDGYENDTLSPKLRINWGWNGNYNGYYTLQLSVPELEWTFSGSQSAIIGLAPDTATIEMEESPDLVMIEFDDFYGIEPFTPTDIKLGSEISFFVGWFMNVRERDITKEFKICLEDKDGNIKQRGWDFSETFKPDYYHSAKTANAIMMEKPLLTDRFRLYITDGKGGWKPMTGNYDYLPDVDGVECGVVQDPVILLPDACSVGQEIELSLTLGFSHVIETVWVVNGTTLDGNKVKLVKGKNAIRADVKYLDGSVGSIFKTLQLE